MKKIFLSLVVLALAFASCGKEKETKKAVEETKTEVKQEAQETTSEAKADDDLYALGEKLFSEKTCVSCHQMDSKVIGPSIKEIVKVYDDKNADIVAFLKGDSEAIVDTDPGQVAIMKANLDGFVKDLSDKELKALSTYMKQAK